MPTDMISAMPPLHLGAPITAPAPSSSLAEGQQTKPSQAKPREATLTFGGPGGRYLWLTSTTRMGSLGVKLSASEAGSAAMRAKAEGELELGMTMAVVVRWARGVLGVLFYSRRASCLGSEEGGGLGGGGLEEGPQSCPSAGNFASLSFESVGASARWGKGRQESVERKMLRRLEYGYMREDGYDGRESRDRLKTVHLRAYGPQSSDHA